MSQCQTCAGGSAPGSASQATLPSIFNDVIGPVMRGPSSSHCAAALRITRLARDLMGGRIQRVLIEFDPEGSLATTHESQGSDMGLFGGLMGWETHDERLADSARLVREAGIEVELRIEELQEKHPNAYQLTLSNAEQEHRIVALSTGGGMIEVVELDGAPVSWMGDCYQTLVWADGGLDSLREAALRLPHCDQVEVHGLEKHRFLAIRSTEPLDTDLLPPSARMRVLRPVLPVLSRRELSVPFTTCDQMMVFNQGKGLGLWELATAYECERGGVTREVVVKKMVEIVRILKQSIGEGLAGTEYDDRILGYQCGRFREKMDAGQLFEGGLLNQIVLYVTALMEVKSSMGVIVAAPTAGACAAMPAAVIAAGEALEKSDEEIAQAFLAAGIIGTFVTIHSSFAAEVGGCQAEGGTAGAMAAAALVDLMGGTAAQAVAAASAALQGLLGLACDPIANRVEAPCLNKNVLAASNALSCANMALADFDPLVPLDQVIEAHAQISRMMPREIRCTALGGLSVTPASKAIEARLAVARLKSEDPGAAP